MNKEGLLDNDVLKNIFELPKEWAKALYSIEYCLTKHSIVTETDNNKRLLKQNWLQLWEEGIITLYNTIEEDSGFSLVRDDLALQDFLRELNSLSTQKSHLYMIIIESLFFTPFYELNHLHPKGVKLKYRLDINYLSYLLKEFNIDIQLLKSFQNRFKKSYMALSGKDKTILIFALVSGIAIAVTGGMLAPHIALLFAAEGLSGAAAISSGLAVLGGGAVAIGGSGMLGGITVLVTAGGIVGVAGGAAVGVLVANSSELATFIAAKLEVYFREVLLPILQDPDKAISIIRGQESFIRSLNEQLEKSPNITDAEKKAIKVLQKTIVILQRGLDRNRKALIKYNARIMGNIS
mgnify:CR=1 FL=1